MTWFSAIKPDRFIAKEPMTANPMGVLSSPSFQGLSSFMPVMQPLYRPHYAPYPSVRPSLRLSVPYTGS